MTLGDVLRSRLVHSLHLAHAALSDAANLLATNRAPSTTKRKTKKVEKNTQHI